MNYINCCNTALQQIKFYLTGIRNNYIRSLFSEFYYLILIYYTLQQTLQRYCNV